MKRSVILDEDRRSFSLARTIAYKIAWIGLGKTCPSRGEAIAASALIEFELALLDVEVEQTLMPSRRPALQWHGVEPEADEDRVDRWRMGHDLEFSG